MTTPSDKSPSIDNAITNAFGIDRKKCIENNVCTQCGGSALEFTDEASKREYSIGGMCQLCQDDFFGEDDDDYEDDDYDRDFEDNLSDVDADAMTLRDAGMGTDEDYGYYGETDIGW